MKIRINRLGTTSKAKARTTENIELLAPKSVSANKPMSNFQNESERIKLPNPSANQTQKQLQSPSFKSTTNLPSKRSDKTRPKQASQHATRPSRSTNADLNQTYRPLTVKFPLAPKRIDKARLRQATLLDKAQLSDNMQLDQHARPPDHCGQFSIRRGDLTDHHDQLWQGKS